MYRHILRLIIISTVHAHDKCRSHMCLDQQRRSVSTFRGHIHISLSTSAPLDFMDGGEIRQANRQHMDLCKPQYGPMGATFSTFHARYGRGGSAGYRYWSDGHLLHHTKTSGQGQPCIMDSRFREGSTESTVPEATKSCTSLAGCTSGTGVRHRRETIPQPEPPRLNLACFWA